MKPDRFAPKVPKVPRKPLKVLIPQCSSQGSQGCRQVVEIVHPEVPAPQSPYPYSGPAPFSGRARLVAGKLAEVRARKAELLAPPPSVGNPLRYASWM